MRHASGLGMVLLLLATGESVASGNSPPPCRTGLWVGTGNMSTQRAGHAAALLPSGKVLVTGGFGTLLTAELYDPATGTWSPTGSMSFQRESFTLTLLPTGKALAVGGARLLQEVRPTELYDPDTGQWTTTASLLDGRELHTATLLSTGKVLVVGGVARGGPGPLASAELYDPGTGTWHATGPLSTARFNHTATLLASGQVLVLGGQTTGMAGGPVQFPPTPSAEVYDPATGSWTPAAPMLAARFQHTATRLRSDAVLVAGGQGSFDVEMEAELYDPAAGTWHQTGSLRLPHTQHTATLLPSGRVLVVGGIFPPLPNTEMFDPESGAWSDSGCTLEPTQGHTATLLLSGAVLVAGGALPDLSSAELYGIVVSPAQVSLAPGASQTFTAMAGSGFGYVWSFAQNESGATLTASGEYRAGPVGGVTDVLRVVDSFANSATATVNVIRQSSAVSATGPSANSMGCGSTGAATFPALGGAVLVLLGWRALRARRPST